MPKRIGCYKKGTSTRGLILNPKDNLSVNCYSNADFAGFGATSILKILIVIVAAPATLSHWLDVPYFGTVDSKPKMLSPP